MTTTGTGSDSSRMYNISPKVFISHTKNKDGTRNDVSLHTHLLVTGMQARAEIFLKGNNQENEFAGIGALIAGICHDVGKISPAFQCYIRKAANSNAPKFCNNGTSLGSKNHAEVGAVFSLPVVSEVCQFLNIQEQQTKDMMTAVFLAILSHHTGQGIINAGNKVNKIIATIEDGLLPQAKKQNNAFNPLTQDEFSRGDSHSQIVYMPKLYGTGEWDGYFGQVVQYLNDLGAVVPEYLKIGILH